MNNMTANYKIALICRSIAVFAVLYQLRLIAAGLADTPVFIAALLAGFSTAVFLTFFRTSGKCSDQQPGRQAGPIAALVIISLVPWVTRFFIAMPRFFISGTDALAINLDALLLNYDRNTFVSLFPFYWTAASTWFSIRSRKFLRAAVIIDATILLVVFSIARTSYIEIYRWPIVMIVLFAAIVFLQAMALLFSIPPQIRPRVKETGLAVAAFLVLIALSGLFFLGPLQQRATERGGGLLQPRLFSFDFAEFLRLGSEISMSNDLLLIVRMEEGSNNGLLRRAVMSGYSRMEGFFRINELDELAHPLRLPNTQRELPSQDFKARHRVTQEYFIVNFDANAFIGMKEPALITPYETWDASSFRAAFSVESMVSNATFFDLMRSTQDGWPAPADLGLTESEFQVLTYYGNNERLRAFAQEITQGFHLYSDKVWIIYNRLKFGEFRYSLRPGIAVDGDQLGLFLFYSKRGYCSYFASAMALLLRSLGIPARVAVGFFVDPAANVFNYYPVRADMAHAWVEVLFPGYGWIEFDPTTDSVAEDEEFSFGAATDTALFERLMREILENRSSMRAREGMDEEPFFSALESLAHNTFALLRNYWGLLFLSIFAGIVLFLRYGHFISVFLAKNPRKRSVRLMKHAWRRLALAGLRCPDGQTAQPEWALGLDRHIKGSYAMYQSAAAARFAPEYSAGDFKLQQKNYADFCISYSKKISLWRRLAGSIFPPLAFALRKSCLTLIIIFALTFFAGSQTMAQNIPGEEYQDLFAADELFMDARRSQRAQLWERAITLYREGAERFPDDPRFPWYLGNLFYSRSLFGLAWDEFRRTEVLVPDSPIVLARLGRTAGHLNKDRISVDYYERALAIDPNNREIIGRLAWMYFKVHRLNDGQRLLRNALERFGDNADFSMTLGTIYAAMHNYEESKYWYKKAIFLGERMRDSNFVAVAWYNLSILESVFFQYPLAMEAANSSIRARDRASGRLARGELFLRQLDLQRALEEFTIAFETDTSPLAKLNLARAYKISGRLQEARLYAQACLGIRDHSWMLNFGIDPNRFNRDVHEILYKTYLGLAKTERFMPWARLSERISSHFRRISYNFKASVHRRLYHKYSLAAADAYGAELLEDGSPIFNSIIQYYHAFQAYPRRALAYLTRARDFQTSIIPASAPSYDLREGILRNNISLIERAVGNFDPLWERKFIAQGYMEIASRSSSRPWTRARRIRAQEAAQELFALNRGALRQAGLALPVNIDIIFPTGRAMQSERIFLRALSRAGFNNSPDITPRYTLHLTISRSFSEYSVIYELIDKEGTTNIIRRSAPLQSFSRADVYDFARQLGNAVFRAE